MNLLDRLTNLERKPHARAYTDEGYNLRAFRAWVDDLGAPDRQLNFLHIAGTKGKGSTAALCEAMLAASGHRTGLYCSPHVEHFGERIRLDGAPLAPAEFDEKLAAFEASLPAEHRRNLAESPDFRTVFEILTALALVEFRDRRRTAVVWETGLGGRLDCTNIVAPRVAAIATIAYDHEAILGATIEAIAGEKAGIIKPDHPAVASRQVFPEAARVLEERAHAVGAPFFRAHEFTPVTEALPAPGGLRCAVRFPDGRTGRTTLPFHGAHQAANFETALTACWLFEEGMHRRPDPEALLEGARRAHMPGRLEVRRHEQKPALVLDGAHCPLSARRLGEALAAWLPLEDPPARPPYALLVGMQGDKNHAAFFGELARAAGTELFHRVVCVRVPGGRGAAPDSLADSARAAGFDPVVAPDPGEALREAVRVGGASILVTGSFYALHTARSAWDALGPCEGGAAAPPPAAP
ncbi:MAG: hypothetical protein SF028_10585 [Candidatus Sumerlaeia bacterium]|nr:hypothetical protein [Candidatus Sumerlaeia bacterium]